MQSKKNKIKDYGEKLFNIWTNKLKEKKCKLYNYKKIGKIYRNNGEKFFVALYDAKIKNKNSGIVSRYITIVKPSVIIMPILYFNKEIFTMLVSQTRIYDGSEIVEFPAGSIDFGQKPIDAAVSEIQEELNINLKKRNLKKANDKPIMIEPSCTSSTSYFFYFKMKIEKSFFKKFHLKRTGHKMDGEIIKIKVQKINKIHHYNSASIHVGLNLIRKYI